MCPVKKYINCPPHKNATKHISLLFLINLYKNRKSRLMKKKKIEKVNGTDYKSLISDLMN